MAVVLSNVVPAARSVSFVAECDSGGENKSMADIAAAYLLAGGSASSAIYSFLTQELDTSAEVAEAIADAGAIISASSVNDAIAVYPVADAFSLYFDGTGLFAVRIALAASISA